MHTHQIFPLGWKGVLRMIAEVSINIAYSYRLEREPQLVSLRFCMICNIVGINKQDTHNSSKWYLMSVCSIIIILSSLYMFKLMLCILMCFCTSQGVFTASRLLLSSLMFHKCRAEIKSLFEAVPISLPPNYPFCTNFLILNTEWTVTVSRAEGQR